MGVIIVDTRMKDEGITNRHGVFVGIPLEGPGSVCEGPSVAGVPTMLRTLSSHGKI